MSKISYTRIVNALPNLSNEQLESLISECVRALDQRGEYIQLLIPGAVPEKMLEDLHVVYHDIINLNAFVAKILGVALAGFGDVPREQIKSLAAGLVAQMERVKLEMLRFDQKYKTVSSIVPDPNTPTPGLDEILHACEDYYSERDATGSRLRALVAMNPFYTGLLEIREAHKPGKKALPSRRARLDAYLDFVSEKIAQKSTIEQAVNAAAGEFADIISRWADPTDQTKTELSRQRKKVSKRFDTPPR